MPEGDTIHRTAATLRRCLVGRALTRVELARDPPLLPALGATVDRVEARGKHLLVATSDGLTIHTHQRMTGSWHVYRPGERWQRSARTARVVLGVADALAVCFAAPVVEVLDDRGLARHPHLRLLGPDLCDPAADLDAVVARSERVSPPGRSIGEVLLDQGVACGIGNVYRSEVAFLHGVDPATPMTAITAAARREMFATAARLLRDNLTTTARTTVPGSSPGTLWVYGRTGDPCRRCGTPIERAMLGLPARATYRCPACQPGAA